MATRRACGESGDGGEGERDGEEDARVHVRRWCVVYESGSLLATVRRRYHSSRVSSNSSAEAAARIRVGLALPMMGMMVEGCLSNQAMAMAVRVVLRSRAMASSSMRMGSGR